MAAEDEIYNFWLKTVRDRQTAINMCIEESEQSLSDGLREFAHVCGKGTPLCLILNSCARESRIITLLRRRWLDEKKPNDLNVLIRENEQGLSDDLEELAPMYKSVFPVLQWFAKSSRMNAMLRKLWQDTEKDIKTVLEDPLSPEHREKMQQMIATCKTTNA